MFSKDSDKTANSNNNDVDDDTDDAKYNHMNEPAQCYFIFHGSPVLKLHT